MTRARTWVIPLCGEGSRTKALGLCKPLIEIKGKTIIEHFLRGIRHLVDIEDDFIYVIRKDHDKSYSIKNHIRISHSKYINTKACSFVTSEGKTSGPCETISLALASISAYNQIIVVNHDQVVDFELPPIMDKQSIYIPLTFGKNIKSSFAKVNLSSCIIEEIKEKEMISLTASAGIYIFPTKKILADSIKAHKELREKSLDNNEQFISHIIDASILKLKITCKPLETFVKYDLGNQESIFRYMMTLK